MKGMGILIIYFFVELGLFVFFAQEFGFLSLVGEILLSGGIGIFLLLSNFSGGNEGIIEFFRGMKTPQEFIASNLTRTLGAILLILPGLLSDCMGLLLVLGIFDVVLIKIMGNFFYSKKNENEIIDVEIIEDWRENEKEDHYRK